MEWRRVGLGAKVHGGLDLGAVLVFRSGLGFVGLADRGEIGVNVVVVGAGEFCLEAGFEAGHGGVCFGSHE